MEGVVSGGRGTAGWRGVINGGRGRQDGGGSQPEGDCRMGWRG